MNMAHKELDIFFKRAMHSNEGYEVHGTEILKRIIKQTKDERIWITYGHFLEILGKNVEAIDIYKKSLDYVSDEKVGLVCTCLGELTTQVEGPAAAQYWYDKSTKGFELQNGDYWINKGHNLKLLGNYLGALECFEFPLKNHIEGFDLDGSYYSRGLLLCLWGKYSEGYLDLKKAHEIDPSFEQTKQYFEEISKIQETIELAKQLRSGEIASEEQLDQYFKKAENLRYEWYYHVVELLREYLKVRPNHVEAWIIYGNCLIGNDNWNEAQIALQKALDLDKGEKKALITRCFGKLSMRHKTPSEAEELYKKATEVPDVVSDLIWFERGGNLANMCNYQLARTCFEESLDCKDNWFKADEKHFKIGFLYRAEGRYDEAALAFSESLRINSDNKEAKACLEGLSNIEETLEECEKIKDLV